MHARAPLALPLGLLALSCASTGDPADAPAWPQFRGPDGRAVAEGTVLPLGFGTDSKVLWKTPLPAGHSSPCIHGDRIFLTGAEGTQLSVVAVRRSDGEVLWTKAFEGEEGETFDHVGATPAMATPCTDGEHVFVYFGSYGLVALDLDGELVWEKRMPVPDYNFGAGASPLLVGDNVILPRDGAPEAAILAFRKADGEPAWEIPRIGFVESHSTPYLWKTSAGEQLVIAGTRQLRGYDPADGTEIWNVDDVTIFTCTTPTAEGDTLYFAAWSTPNATGRHLLEQSFGTELGIQDEEIQDLRLLFDRLDQDGDGKVLLEDVPPCRARDAFSSLDRDKSGAWEREEFGKSMPPPGIPGKNVVVAVEAGGEGDVTESHVRWSWRRGIPYVASPLVYRGRVWMLKAGGMVTVLDAETGERVLDRERLPERGEYYLSPVGIGEYVLAGAAEGVLYVLDADADELSVVHSVDFEDELYATPAALEDKLYVRTRSMLWAFGESTVPQG